MNNSGVGFIIAVIVFLFIGIGTMIFTFQKCGAKALFFGKSAFIVAASGTCDK